MGKNRSANPRGLPKFTGMKKLLHVLKSEYFWLSLIILLGAFLRFWKIEEWQYFSYDQARDYLIIKRIILDHKLTLVGPTVLAPGVYLPPFYYYSLIPVLLISEFHLVGPDVYTAFLGTMSILIFFLLVKDLFGKKPALLSSLIFSLNPYLIHSSRHAWNPNTIYFFTLLFALSFERYLFDRKRNCLILASFCLSWAINLHYTALMLLPLLIFLWIKEFNQEKLSRQLLLSWFIFLFFISPIFLFELRHNFPNTKGILTFFRGQSNNMSFWRILRQRILKMLVDWIKMPLVFFSGLNQSDNLTISSPPISPFDKVSLLNDIHDWSVKLKLAFFPMVVALPFFGLSKILRSEKGRFIKVTFLFLGLGFMIRLFFPPNSFYFYHYTFLFPFSFLVVSLLFYILLENIKIRPRIAGTLIAVIFCFASWLPKKIIDEPRTEKYFLPSCEIMAKDFDTKVKTVIAANVNETTRWEHNGLEYRYFLEAIYRLPLSNWEKDDYEKADVLYLIDEGDLPEPLKLGGMEMEAFGPQKIEKVWRVETGQKIYKLTN